jgi:hypothetical protein
MAESTTPVRILYTNWRGETAVRRIVPGPLWFGSTEWHPEPQWLMTADEPDNGKRRDFALSGIKAWGDGAILDLDQLGADCDLLKACLRIVEHVTDDQVMLRRVRIALASKCEVPRPLPVPSPVQPEI